MRSSNAAARNDRRPRGAIALLLALTIAAGLASREVDQLPMFVIVHAGDALWSVALYWTLAFAWPTARGRTLAIATLLGSYAVEFSQLMQMSWLDAIRRHHIWHLLLGQGFDPIDLVRYAIGVAIAMVVDRSLWLRRRL